MEEDNDKLDDSKQLDSGSAIVGQVEAEDPNARQISSRGVEDVNALKELNEARIEESGFLDDSLISFNPLQAQLPRGPTTLMTAADVRAAKVFDGVPLIFPAWRNPNLVFKWPRSG